VDKQTERHGRKHNPSFSGGSNDAVVTFVCSQTVLNCDSSVWNCRVITTNK